MVWRRASVTERLMRMVGVFCLMSGLGVVLRVIVE